VGSRSTFNESFNFKLPAESLDTASITIQLMYSQPGYNKGIYGSGTLNIFLSSTLLSNFTPYNFFSLKLIELP